MSFDPITSFFDKFKKITLPNETVRKKTSDVLHKVININIGISCISVENNIVRVKKNSLIKSEIFLNKEQILKCLKEELGDQAPEDIL